MGCHIVTDLDGTWLPAPTQREDSRRLERAVLDRSDIVLTFATGRTYTVALEAIDQWELRTPHHLITDVGTALFHRAPGGGWREDARWTERVLSVWDEQAAETFLAHHLPASVCAQPGVLPIRRLALQRANGADMAVAGAELSRACEEAGLRVDVLPSHDLYFDVLPRGIHKGAALAFLQASLDLPRPVVGCGDSANDLGLFEAADHPVLMKGGLEDSELPPEVRSRAIRTPVPGPRGIHLALIACGLLEEDDHGH